MCPLPLADFTMPWLGYAVVTKAVWLRMVIACTFTGWTLLDTAAAWGPV